KGAATQTTAMPIAILAPVLTAATHAQIASTAVNGNASTAACYQPFSFLFCDPNAEQVDLTPSVSREASDAEVEESFSGTNASASADGSYIGGNGCRFSNWLSTSGVANVLCPS